MYPLGGGPSVIAGEAYVKYEARKKDRKTAGYLLERTFPSRRTRRFHHPPLATNRHFTCAVIVKDRGELETNEHKHDLLKRRTQNALICFSHFDKDLTEIPYSFWVRIAVFVFAYVRCDAHFWRRSIQRPSKDDWRQQRLAYSLWFCALYHVILGRGPTYPKVPSD